MKAIKIVAMLLGLFIGIPIRFYLIHFLLVAAHGDRLILFLFWVDVFVTVPVAVMLKIVEESAAKEAGKK
jgi:hypothetical protein